jgi:hypothetical protein
MGLFDKTGTATAGQDTGDISTSGMGSLLPELFQKAINEGILNPNNTSPQEFESFVVTNPDLVDPSIDVSGLKTTTDTSPYLLGNIPDYGGIQYESYNPRRLSDLMNLYNVGLPTLATDTAQIPGAIDTLVDTGGGGGMDQVTGGLDTGNTAFEQNLLDQGIGVQGAIGDPVVAPGEMPVTQEEMDAFNQIPVTPSLDDIDLGNPTGDPRVVSEEQGLVGTPSYIDPIMDPNLMAIRQQQTLETQKQQEGFIQNVLGRAGQTVEGALNELGRVPGAVVDFANQTVDFFGKKLNVGKTLFNVGINKLAGGPISLIFDLLPSQDPADILNRNIVDELKAEKDYGYNMSSGTLNQDPFGRNPVSLFGNYEQTLLNDATSTGTTKMALAKKEFAQDYFDKKAGKTAPQEDIGATDSLKQLQAEKDAEIATKNELAKLTGDINLDNFDTTNEAAVNVGTPSFEGFDSGGFDPAPAPAPAPAPSYNYGGGGGRDRDSGGRNGGGGGSPGSAGPGGSDEMGSF